MTAACVSSVEFFTILLALNDFLNLYIQSSCSSHSNSIEDQVPIGGIWFWSKL